MSFEVARYKWQTGTRPSTFSLALDGGSVFADFDVDPNGLISLVRVSFDGYGAWSPTGSQTTTTMDPGDAVVLQRALRQGTLNCDEVRSLLRNYFHANSTVIWRDALEQYELLPRS